jgi:hypothetical protein
MADRTKPAWELEEERVRSTLSHGSHCLDCPYLFAAPANTISRAVPISYLVAGTLAFAGQP